MKQETESLNISELAEKYKLDRRMVVARLKKAGIEPVFKKASGTIYDVSPELDEVLSQTDEDLDELKKEKLRAEVELKQIQAAEKRGEFVAASEVRETVSKIFSGLFREFQRKNKKIASKLAKAKETSKVSEILQTEDSKIFERLRTNYTEFLV